MTKIQKHKKQLDKMGTLHNQLIDLISSSGVSLSDTILILELIKDDCKDNFKLQLQINQAK
jgi:hypothetical protein